MCNWADLKEWEADFGNYIKIYKIKITEKLRWVDNVWTAWIFFIYKADCKDLKKYEHIQKWKLAFDSRFK